MKLDPKYLNDIIDPVNENENVNDIVNEMFNIMYIGKGVGLAANQIGINKRIIVIDNQKGFKQAFINPVIVKKYGGKNSMIEGCLSFPGKKVKIVRSKNLIIEAKTPEGLQIRRKLKGFTARIVQHEIDHLNGITINNY